MSEVDTLRIARLRPDGADPVISIGSADEWTALPSELKWHSLLELAIDGRLQGFLQESDGRLYSISGELASAAPIADVSAPIWGAGLNYRGHSEDLETAQPKTGPGSYLRPANSLLGNGEEIIIPTQSNRVTAEAELGLVIGRQAKNVRADNWRSVVVGLTTVLDMTAEDAIRINPRYIPWSKGFDAFCSIGPQLVTLDEFSDDLIQEIEVSTVRNGLTESSDTPASMKYSIGDLVEYFSAGRTLAPGTVICTGTPGATQIVPGDCVEAVVAGVGHLVHPVRSVNATGSASSTGSKNEVCEGMDNA